MFAVGIYDSRRVRQSCELLSFVLNVPGRPMSRGCVAAVIRVLIAVQPLVRDDATAVDQRRQRVTNLAEAGFLVDELAGEGIEARIFQSEDFSARRTAG